MKKIPVIGKKFGRLLVLEEFPFGEGKKRKLKCKCLCDCGKTIVVDKGHLLRHHTQSCGCYRDERSVEANLKHGLTRSSIFKSWSHMKDRCDNTNCKDYVNYGGRGITYVKEWKDFSVFLKWSMENGYKKGLTIDRINNDDNYKPENCRWVGKYEQSNNRRCNINVTYKGEVHTLSQWCKLLDLKYPRTYYRLVVKGYDVDKAFMKERLYELEI